MISESPKGINKDSRESASEWADSQPPPPKETHRYPKKRKPKAKVPKGYKPAAFYVSPLVERDWFDTEADWEAARYILNLIWWRTVNGYGISSRDPDQWVRLKADYLRRVIGTRWRAVKSILIDKGVLEVGDGGNPGQARSYRLRKGYRKTKRFECTDDHLNQRLAAVQAEEDRSLPWMEGLRSWQNKLTVDWAIAQPLIEQLKLKKPKVEDYEEVLITPLETLADGDGWLSTDKVGRVHTPVVNMKRELRVTLRLNKEPLVGVDVSGCQLLILGAMVRDWYVGTWERRQTLETYDPPSDPYLGTKDRITNSQPPSPTTKPTNPPITVFQKPQLSVPESVTTNRRSDALPSDLSEFIFLCESGQLYPLFDNQKRLLLQALFERNDSSIPPLRDMQVRFAARFPSVATVVRRLKSRESNRLALLLQNYEATLMIHGACRRLLKQYPTVPIFPVHDAIWTTRPHVDLVKQVIWQEFGEWGIRPLLKSPTA